MSLNAIILAPPYSGKTFFCDAYPTRARDGDVVVAQSIGFPPAKWWLDVQVAAAHWLEQARVLSRAPLGAPILFNGDNASIRAYFSGRIRCVLPSYERLVANEQRAGRSRASAPSVGEALRCRDNLTEDACVYGWPVFSSIESAILDVETKGVWTCSI